METVEMVGFLIFTIVVAGLILSFFFQLDFTSVSKSVSQMFNPKSDDFDNLQKLNINQFVGRLNSCWQQCRFGAVNADCGNVQLTTDGMEQDMIDNGVTVNSLTEIFEKLNFCTDCSVAITSPPIKPPAVVSVFCRTDGDGVLVIAN